jgi:hypothetical protein
MSTLKMALRLLAPLVFSSALFTQFDTAEVLGSVKDPGGNIPVLNNLFRPVFHSPTH